MLTQQQEPSKAYVLAGIFTLSLRLIVGWTYFSAFWRRLVLENKLIPDGTGYIGEKFNHFLPNAIGIKPIIEYLVSTPDLLWWAMVIFTLVEGIVGLLYMLGFFTRLMSIGVFSLAFGILLGSGWLGTTCLDEWQIGILGVSAGFTIFLSGGGKYSLDYLLLPKLSKNKWLVWLTSGELPLSIKQFSKVAISGAVLLFILTLYTNQVFHNGVWGPLHNKSVKPELEISNAKIQEDILTFKVYRIEGADVYGSFLIGITLKDENGKTILQKNGEELARFPLTRIKNDYVAKVAPGKHSLIIPLGSKATLTIRSDVFVDLPKGDYELILTDISGITWKENITVK
ncbi:TQO small subunit DoxD [Bacteroides thetaiotaomicron]|uniref:TQO small subunit DoxD n=1 Tax=Bacteroides thetaiotaomicron TaxID=818 RepID=UPI001897E940|nr:TQO small subunit DoxD [Bacteroides thetaiotaomicron]MCS2865313.1 quinol oxidase [Bacteroides thetaiotaomicron]MDC2272586.1 TQO small subunit DoxD [Bacteroides thetaiotaomicron]GKH21134.1 quinol oxidase [Bacteroides thetaiotaomicron]GKH66934.1 quinol oxidase [Bacteroides thetaiotaomicron]